MMVIGGVELLVGGEVGWRVVKRTPMLFGGSDQTRCLWLLCE